MTFKYIVFRDEFEIEIPVLFTDVVHHNAVSCGNRNAISAGIAAFMDGNITCYGQSLALGLHSRPEEDAALIKRGNITM